MKTPRTLPLAVLSDAGIASARETSASTAERMELLAIWDRLSSDSRKVLLVVAQKMAELSGEAATVVADAAKTKR